MIQKITGHMGRIIWETSKPDGTPRKLLDVSKMNNQGWEAKIPLEDGISSTYEWFLKNIKNIKEVKI
jgi:GDP-L-fucose synthase